MIRRTTWFSAPVHLQVLSFVEVCTWRGWAGPAFLYWLFHLTHSPEITFKTLKKLTVFLHNFYTQEPTQELCWRILFTFAHYKSNSHNIESTAPWSYVFVTVLHLLGAPFLQKPPALPFDLTLEKIEQNAMSLWWKDGMMQQGWRGFWLPVWSRFENNVTGARSGHDCSHL